MPCRSRSGSRACPPRLALLPGRARGRRPEFPPERTGLDRRGGERHYRLQVDPASGAVISLFDRDLAREMTDPAAPHRLAQLLRASGGGDAHGASMRSWDGPRMAAVLHLPPAGTPGRLPAVTQEITLYHTLKRIDVATRLLRDRRPRSNSTRPSPLPSCAALPLRSGGRGHRAPARPVARHQHRLLCRTALGRRSRGRTAR